MTDETKEILIEQMDSMRAELMKAHEAIGKLETRFENVFGIIGKMHLPTDQNYTDLQKEIVEMCNIIKRV